MKSWKKPTPEQVDRAVLYLVHLEHRRRFFDRLDNPNWLRPLWAQGFFRQPPAVERHAQRNTIAHPMWPESKYVARMARHDPKAVLEIVGAMPATDNISVQGDILDAALAMPPELAKQLVPTIRKWLNGPVDLFLVEKLGGLMRNLASGGCGREGLCLMKSLLALRSPQAGKKDGDAEGGHWSEPRAKFDTYFYGEVLQKYAPTVVTTMGLPALEVLCKVLRRAIQIHGEGLQSQTEPQDYSYTWCRTVEHATGDAHTRLRNALVAAVSDAAMQVARRDDVTVCVVVEALEKYKWPIFLRMSLDFLRRLPVADPTLIEARLANRLIFERHSDGPEYALLAESAFDKLSDAGRGTILGWIEEGPDLEKWRKGMENWFGQRPTTEDIEGYAARWRLKRLHPIRDSLPREWRQRYTAMVERYGEPRHASMPTPDSFCWRGETSPKQPEDLQRMPVSEIVEFLQSWRPSDDWDGPSSRGLASALRKSLAEQPEKFAIEAGRFGETAPFYIGEVMDGFRELAKGQSWKSEWWEPVLGLCRSVSQKTRRSNDQAGVTHGDEASMWGSARRAVLRFLSVGLEDGPSSIPLSLRPSVWETIVPMTSDPEPTPADDARYGEEGRDYVRGSLNTVRGNAIEAVIRYALWVRRCSGESLSGLVGAHQCLGQMPEVRAMLDAHLDPEREPSPIIRSVYGRWFPWLGLSDDQWARERAASVFAHEAAWESYIVWCRPYDEVFRILKNEYAAAVDRLNATTSPSAPDYDPSEHLAEHLMVFLGRGIVRLDESGGLIERFFAIAPTWLRGHAIEFVGDTLEGQKGAIPDEVLERFRGLWARRTAAIAASEETRDRHPELVAFGSWFVSGQFDDDWALEQLKNAVQISKWSEPESEVVEGLTRFVGSHPGDVLECLRVLIEGGVERWHMRMWSTHIREILGVTLQSLDLGVKGAARAMVNQLGQRGYIEFGDLLQ